MIDKQVFDIDKQVTEKIFNKSVEGDNPGVYFMREYGDSYPIPKPYSTDMNCAMEVVERVKNDWAVTIRTMSPNGFSCLLSRIIKVKQDEFYADIIAIEESLPLAICKAALMAIGESDGG